MVARTPPQQKLVAAINPVLLRDTVQKMDRCMARLREIQYTVTGGGKVISGVSLSPRGTKGYMKASLGCRHESLRLKNASPKKSPVGKFPANKTDEWRKMSLPAMLVGETLGEIIQASQFAKEIVAAVNSAKAKKAALSDDPKTPVTGQRKQRHPNPEDTDLAARRMKEKQFRLQATRAEPKSPNPRRAQSRIVFKLSHSPPRIRREAIKDSENRQHLENRVNRVSPRNRPWERKAVLFPNPLFNSTMPSSSQQKLSRKTRSPVIRTEQTTPHKFLIKSPASPWKRGGRIRSNPPTRTRQTTPHKFLIKSSPASPPKVGVRIRSPPIISISSPTRPPTNIITLLNKKISPKVSTASRLRRSLSPARLANRLMSPLRSRKGTRQQRAGCDV